ncbi:MAG: hypothetical protein KF914_02955 [Rhizobiaceae bacterium]|nr:hypothetical protein [Rhizobiaceae bacterium]
MVEIISKRDGPHRQDAQMRRVLEQNRATITRIADHLSNGAYTASRTPKPEPRAEGLIIHVGASPQVSAPAPAIRVSLNGRVVMVDDNTGRQMHHLGDIRAGAGGDRFVLATKSNGYFAPVDDEIARALQELDGAPVHTDGEDRLAEAVRDALFAR